MNQTEDSVVNDELLLARRLRTLKVLDKIGVWDIVESPEQATNTMEVVQKIAAGDVPSGNVIALLKVTMEKNQNEVSAEEDEELLQAKRLQTLQRFDKIGVWKILETQEQATKLMDVFNKVATGEVSSKNVIALLKDGFELKDCRVLNLILPYLDHKDLMMLRLTCKRWKNCVDRQLDFLIDKFWLPRHLSSEMPMLGAFSRQHVPYRFCCKRDMVAFTNSDLNSEDIADDAVLICKVPCIMIGSAHRDLPISQHKKSCGSRCMFQSSYSGNDEFLNNVGFNNQKCRTRTFLPLTYVKHFLSQIGSSLNVVIFSNIAMNSNLLPGDILLTFHQILSCLESVKVIILNHAFDSTEYKALEPDGVPIDFADILPNECYFRHLKKLVISGGSMDVAEYSLYSAGPFVKRLTLVDPFKLQRHGSFHSCLLTPLENQAHRLICLEELILEITQIDGGTDDQWNRLARALSGKFGSWEMHLRVNLHKTQARFIAYVVALASTFPYLTELTIYVENPHIRHYWFLHPSPETIHCQELKLLRITKLCIGSNILQTPCMREIMSLVRMMEKLETIEFFETGLNRNLSHTKSWLLASCMELDLFTKCPCLMRILAFLNGNSVEIIRDS